MNELENFPHSHIDSLRFLYLLVKVTHSGIINFHLYYFLLSCVPSWVWTFDNTYFFLKHSHWHVLEKYTFLKVLFSIWLCPRFHFFTVIDSKITWSLSFKVAFTSASQWLLNFWYLISAGTAEMTGSLFAFGFSSWASLQCDSLRISRKAWGEAAATLDVKDWG